MGNELAVTIKRIDRSIPLPSYGTPKAAAVDLYARESLTIPAHQLAYVPLNIALQLPPDHYALIAARSSLHKKGLLVANGIGIGDEDFSGDGDEYKAIVLNFTDQEARVEKGERIAQMIILPRQRVVFTEVEYLGGPDRGGIGSTGF